MASLRTPAQVEASLHWFREFKNVADEEFKKIGFPSLFDTWDFDILFNRICFVHGCKLTSLPNNSPLQWQKLTWIKINMEEFAEGEGRTLDAVVPMFGDYLATTFPTESSEVYVLLLRAGEWGL